VLAYHGTAHCLLAAIREHGLVCRPSAAVYVTTDRLQARDYAARTTAYETARRGSLDRRAVVLTVDAPDRLIFPDPTDDTGTQWQIGDDLPTEALIGVDVFDPTPIIEAAGADRLALAVDVSRRLEDFQAGHGSQDPRRLASDLRRLGVDDDQVDRLLGVLAS
jgi:hypothetical protein